MLWWQATELAECESGHSISQHSFPLIKDNKPLGTGSLLGNERLGVQKQDGNWLWENVLILMSRNGRRLKKLAMSLAKTKVQGMMGIYGLLPRYPENKAAGEGGG